MHEVEYQRHERKNIAPWLLYDPPARVFRFMPISCLTVSALPALCHLISHLVSSHFSALLPKKIRSFPDWFEFLSSSLSLPQKRLSHWYPRIMVAAFPLSVTLLPDASSSLSHTRLFIRVHFLLPLIATRSCYYFMMQFIPSWALFLISLFPPSIVSVFASLCVQTRSEWGEREGTTASCRITQSFHRLCVTYSVSRPPLSLTLTHADKLFSSWWMDLLMIRHRHTYTYIAHDRCFIHDAGGGGERHWDNGMRGRKSEGQKLSSTMNDSSDEFAKRLTAATTTTGNDKCNELSFIVTNNANYCCLWMSERLGKMDLLTFRPLSSS